RLVDPSDQPVVDGQTGEHREVALGDAECHVGAPGVAPIREDATALKNKARRPTARLHGSHDLAPGSGFIPFDDADVATIVIIEAARPGAVAGFGEGDGGRQLNGVEPRLACAHALPVASIGTRKVGRAVGRRWRHRRPPFGYGRMAAYHGYPAPRKDLC